MSKLKVLCLHGQQTSAEILEWQLRPLGNRLEQDLGITFHHVDGLIETAPHTSFQEIFDPPFYDWIHWPESDKISEPEAAQESQATVGAVLDHLDDVVAEQGPFDGILGFSQGASVACSYLLHLDRRDGSCGSFRFAYFFSSGGLSAEHLKLLALATSPPTAGPVDGTVPDQMLSIPSLHIYGTLDELKGDALGMTRLWERGTITTVTHPGGHVIPRDASSVSKIAAAAKLMMRRVVS